jgi:hypothetical protein
LQPSVQAKAAFDYVANRRTAIPMPPVSAGIFWLVHDDLDAVYPAAFIGLSVIAIIVILWRRPSFFSAPAAALLFLTILITSRVMFFALIDAAAWNGAQTRYLFSIEPLIMIFPIVALGLAWQPRNMANQLQIP